MLSWPPGHVEVTAPSALLRATLEGRTLHIEMGPSEALRQWSIELPRDAMPESLHFHDETVVVRTIRHLSGEPPTDCVGES